MNTAVTNRRRVLISGAGGLLGSALAPGLLDDGFQIVRLGRGSPRVRPSGAQEDAISWNPAEGMLDAELLEGMDTVVHLAGENVAGGRWNRRRRHAIRQSRVAGTDLLARALASRQQKPGLLICASAVGYYGNGQERWLDEDSPPGHDFLSEVGRAWEAAADPARAAGIRVVHLRLGIVLSPAGGALQRMLPVFRLGLGGRLGHGRQYMSWLTLPEAIAIIRFVMAQESLYGPVNAVAPEPVTNATFTAALGRVLRRPALLPAPSWAVSAALGEMGRALLLNGQRVRPRRLQDAGYRFLHPQLEPALAAMLGGRI